MSDDFAADDDDFIPMAREMPMIHVAAAVIKDERDRILICRRGPGGSCEHLWEFPGGKREEGETLRECLKRECAEELGATVTVGQLLLDVTFSYPEQEVHLAFFEASLVGGEIKSLVHSEIRWIEKELLGDYDFCPADQGLVERLQNS
ncbi:MAG: (deoxy)nucleoside triphosphate pyrophosphohydrolase [Deltaproteobacteria bacterium]|nr:(deoxy)nucleoside triphosphate pyrophosphohydrolase [Deltaproteobacteria bacterium]